MLEATENCLPFEDPDEEKEEQKRRRRRSATGEDDAGEEGEDGEDTEPTCCEREAGLCTWAEPESSNVDEADRKVEDWTNVDCDDIHPDDLAIIRGRYHAWLAAQKAAANALVRTKLFVNIGLLETVLK